MSDLRKVNSGQFVALWSFEATNKNPADQRNFSSITYFRTTKVGCSLELCGEFYSLYCLLSPRSWIGVPPFTACPAINCTEPANDGKVVTDECGQTADCTRPPIPEFNSTSSKRGTGCMVPMGCYRDAANRDLSGASWNDGLMTLEKCKMFCLSRGFRYMGLQVGVQCFCGNTVGTYGQIDFASNCMSRAGGDAAQWGGGPWANVVYDISQCAGQGTCTVTNGLPQGSYVGCFQYTNGQWSTAYSGTSGMTIAQCNNYCVQNSFAYAGLYQTVCFCGPSQVVNNPRDESKCNYNCYGYGNKAGSKCGSASGTPYLSIYAVSSCFVPDIVRKDWRETVPNPIAPVRDQGSCGSCYAHAATEVLESMFAIQHNSGVPMLSVAQVAACSYGCGGGYMDRALDDIADTGVACSASVQPDNILAWNGCPANKANAPCRVYPSNSFTPRWTWQDMTNYLNSNGPIGVAIYASPGLQGYGGGIWTGYDCGNNIINHAVVIDGWGVTFDNVPYWLVRNSWGLSWGEAGYVRFLLGSNICQIETYPFTVRSKY